MKCGLIIRWTLPISLLLYFVVFPTIWAGPCEVGQLSKLSGDSDVVIAGYTRAVFKDDPKTDYSAEFLVFNVFKGEDIVQRIFDRRKPSALESALTRRLLNVSHFGQCLSEVTVGETYFLFLSSSTDRSDNLLSVAAEPYSREKEELIFESVGDHSWSEWSSCSSTCGGGLQQRRRFCNSTNGQRCNTDDGQQRACNTFHCSGVFDVLEAVGLRKSLMHPADRTTAYRLLPKNSWRTVDQVVLPRTFPWEFSLLIFFRTKIKPQGNEGQLSAPMMSLGGFLFRILVDDNFQAGLHADDRSLSLVLSAQDNVRVTYDHDGVLTDGRWHAVAIAVRRDAATFFADCRPASTLPVRARLRPFAGRPVTVVVGSLGKRDPHAFQGDVEQLLISESPSASVEQCSPVTQPLVSRSHGLPLRDEIRKVPHSELSGPQSDQQTNRGDILIEDDEDFAFGDETGSGTNALDDDPKAEQKETKKGIPLMSENDETEDEGEYDEYPAEDDEDDRKEDNPDNNSVDEPDDGSGSHPDSGTEWSDWSPCSRTCDWGIRTRTLYCSGNALSLDDCASHVSERKQTETCFMSICKTTTTDLVTTMANNVSSNSSTSTATEVTTWGTILSTKAPCRVNCQNGGKCKRPDTCLCTSSYYGKFCQYPICKPVCRNGAACASPNKCQCKNGYVGNYCEKPVCPLGCKNGGRCIAPDRCACPSGYSGNDCGTPRCYPSCHNGGHCVKPYSCHCPPSTRGTFCEKFVCWPDCRNGGVCTGPGKCACPRGFRGMFCEEAYCPEGCENGGRCGKTGKCLCLPGYHGQHCEIRKCFFVEIKEPYKRGYKQKVVTKEQVPCGAWGWKQCTKMKVHYETVFKTFYRTAYRCEQPAAAVYPMKKKLKSIYSKIHKMQQKTSNET